MPRKTILTVVGNVNDSGISLYTDNFAVLANLNLDPAAAVTEDVDLLDTCLSINLDVNLKEPQHSSPVATRTLSSSTPKASRISESVVPTSQPASIVDATNLELVRDGTPLTSAVPAVASAASKYCSLKYSQHSLPRDDADEGPRIDVAIGSTLPGTQYCVEALLGSGSYGAVYRVQDASTGIPYAAKCVEVHPAYDWNSGDDAYACYERAVHVKVQGHPNVLTLHDGFIADGSFWMILELCRGGDLRDLVSSNYFWQHPDRVKPMFLQIVDAVAHCHSKGWAHNDLKPDNILLSYEHDVAYLADFGMASESDSDTILGGTTPYIAPEFLLDTRPDEVLFKTTKNDVWAIGIILLEMVFDHRPWSEAAPTADRKYNDYLIMPFKWRRTLLRRNFPLTRDAATLIARILEPNPALRISLDELRAAVQNIESFVCAEDKLKAGSRAEQIYQRLQAGPQKEASDSFATAKAAQ
ncbi:kinase-like domain-containing protein [Amylostereum chailletii]|nr:kinase-like domain-containing protein [Amylostereum chailletii]